MKQWFDDRFPLDWDIVREFGSEPVPYHLRRWWWCLGGTPAYLFIVMAATGILMTFYYVPEPQHAYDSVKKITEEVPMNLKADKWVLGVDYDAAPTCATCHMSATRSKPVTHDVGARINWTLRPVISKKLENWKDQREDMKDVCKACHAPAFVDGFYKQFDSTVEMYNDKFATPAQDIMNKLREKGKLTTTPFDEELEWTFYRLWHHEGRRARMGVSMQGPDYTQWHGFFEVAENFYMKFIPEAKEAAHGDAEVLKLIETILDRPEHKWKKGMSQDQAEQVLKFYRDRYGATPK